MAFERRFKKDAQLVEHFQQFIDSLFQGEKPCDLLNKKTSKIQLVKHFAGGEYASFDEFNKSLKSHGKREGKRLRREKFLKQHGLQRPPQSSYAVFLRDEKESYGNKHPNAPPKEIKEIMDAAWKKMKTKEKSKYESRFEVEKEDFLKKVGNIDNEAVVLFDASKKIKRPPGAYALFMREKSKEYSENPKYQGENHKDIMSAVAADWKKLSDKAKTKYEKKAVELKEKFEKDHPDLASTKTSKSKKTQKRDDQDDNQDDNQDDDQANDSDDQIDNEDE